MSDDDYSWYRWIVIGLLILISLLLIFYMVGCYVFAKRMEDFAVIAGCWVKHYINKMFNDVDEASLSINDSLSKMFLGKPRLSAFIDKLKQDLTIQQ